MRRLVTMGFSGAVVVLLMCAYLYNGNPGYMLGAIAMGFFGCLELVRAGRER